MAAHQTWSPRLRDLALSCEVQSAQGASRPTSVAFLSSFPPRACGITTDLVEAVDQAQPKAPPAQVIAIQPEGQSYRYGPRVRWTIERDRPSSYEQAAAAINRTSVEVVSIQHEYGLFGGEQGADLPAFVRAVQKPVVLTLHTVLEQPSPALRQVTEALAAEASAIVVLAERAKQILAEHYPGIPQDKLWFIPHGTPVATIQPTAHVKRALGWEHRTILSTFGLLSPGKGIEEALSALPRVVERHPECFMWSWVRHIPRCGASKEKSIESSLKGR
jgi:glycosyltransferase involved in cell wall biosynthesis